MGTSSSRGGAAKNSSSSSSSESSPGTYAVRVLYNKQPLQLPGASEGEYGGCSAGASGWQGLGVPVTTHYVQQRLVPHQVRLVQDGA
jgi:hypothetical protein